MEGRDYDSHAPAVNQRLRHTIRQKEQERIGVNLRSRSMIVEEGSGSRVLGSARTAETYRSPLKIY
jgi:hypothetical protein